MVREDADVVLVALGARAFALLGRASVGEGLANVPVARVVC